MIHLGVTLYIRINSRRGKDLNVKKITENTISKESHKRTITAQSQLWC